MRAIDGLTLLRLLSPFFLASGIATILAAVPYLRRHSGVGHLVLASGCVDLVVAGSFATMAGAWRFWVLALIALEVLFAGFARIAIVRGAAGVIQSGP